MTVWRLDTKFAVGKNAVKDGWNNGTAFRGDITRSEEMQIRR